MKYAKHIEILGIIFTVALLFSSCLRNPFSSDKDKYGPPGWTPVQEHVDCWPCWSPDGEWIVYVHYAPNAESTDTCLSGLYVIKPDGSEKKLLLQGFPIYDPDWSPNGEWIVFWINQLFKIKPNGDSLRKISYYYPHYNPDWSPDSRKIAFDGQGLCFFDVDGQHQRRIFDYGRFPDWSPNGNKILCIRCPGGELSTPDFWLVDTTGKDSTLLFSLSGGEVRDPLFSPDGSKIAYNRQPLNGSWCEPPQIWVSNVDGTNKQQLTTEGGDGQSWSPDGQKIVFCRYNSWDYSDSSGKLFIMNADGSEKQQLTF
jgi:Tol biopolymer transport system component